MAKARMLEMSNADQRIFWVARDTVPNISSISSNSAGIFCLKVLREPPNAIAIGMMVMERKMPKYSPGSVMSCSFDGVG